MFDPDNCSSSSSDCNASDCNAAEPLGHKYVTLQQLHNDEHVQLVFKDEVAFPPGCSSFVDTFKASSLQRVEAPRGKVLHALRQDGSEIYAIEGRGAQSAEFDIDAMYQHVQNLPDVAATNMATNTYRGVRGYGFVGGVGSRFLYTAEKGTRGYYQDKVGPWACKPGRESQRKNILHWVQRGGNMAVQRIEKWGPTYKGELHLQRQLMDKICSHSGTASFTFPSAQVGVNGGYGVHKDKRDCRRTVWLVTGTGGLVFPAYEHVLWLHPGDILVFNGEGEWHGNMVSPIAEQRRLVVESICTTVESGALVQSSPDKWIPQLAGDNDASDEPLIPQMQQAAARAAAREELRRQNLPNHMVQQIVTYYFQRQQRSYFLNDYNRQQPAASAEINAADFDFNPNQDPHEEESVNTDETQRAVDTESAQLSTYERERLHRIREHEAVIARLGIANMARQCIAPSSSLRI